MFLIAMKVQNQKSKLSSPEILYIYQQKIYHPHCIQKFMKTQIEKNLLYIYQEVS